EERGRGSGRGELLARGSGGSTPWTAATEVGHVQARSRRHLVPLRPLGHCAGHLHGGATLPSLRGLRGGGRGHTGGGGAKPAAAGGPRAAARGVPGGREFGGPQPTHGAL
ncbi:unnamed protein product, partial [Effrenium voratum]